MKFTNEIFIARSPRVVFSFVGDARNIPRWNYAVAKTQMISAEFAGVGTLYRQQRKFLGRTLEDTFIVTEYQPDSLLTIRSVEAEYPFLISYSVKSSGQGTMLTNSFELHGTFADNMLGVLFKNRAKSAVAKNLEKLKSLIEKD